MNKNNVLSKKQQYLAVGASVVLSLLVVWVVVSGATTISTNIATDGTLSVTDASTLTGLATMTGGFISSASSTVNHTLTVSNALRASSTLEVTGAATLRSTLGVTSLATMTGGFVSSASSTVNAAMNVTGNFGVGTSTPGTEMGVSSNSGTTTLRVWNSASAKGSCIEMDDMFGTAYYMTIATSGVAAEYGTGTTTAGSAGFIAVWVPGHCE